MSVWQIFKVSRKTFFNPRAWLNIDSVKENNRSLWLIVSDLFSPAAPTRSETFEEAKERFGLTEGDLQRISRNYLIYAYLLAICGVLLIAFGVYLVFVHRTGSGLILSFLASALFFAQAFRFHFWHFQIKVRKLGCTFDEWLQGKAINRDTTA